ncbi:MAG: hypothetical protein ACTS2F_31005 [Thainema sp.]
MPLLPILIGSSTVFGMGYFCVDIYRNRRRLSEKAVPEANLTCYELGVPDEIDVHAIGQTLSHAEHAIGEATSEYMSGGIGHCVEAIAHSLSNH